MVAAVDFSTSPGLIRVFDRLPLSLPVTGTLIGLVHFFSIAALGLALSPTLAGEYLGWGSGYGLVNDIVHSVVVGYMTAAGYYGLREAVRDFLSLEPALSCGEDEFGRMLADLSRVHRAPLYIAGAVAFLWGFSIPLVGTSWAGTEPPALGSALMTLRQIEEIVFVFFIFRTLALEFIAAFFFASVARRFARIELVDLQRVAPFSRRALRGVLVVMVFMAILSLLVAIDPDPTTSMIGVIGSSLAAVALFVIPLLPLQRRIQAEKSSELTRIGAAIRREKEASVADDEDWAPRADLMVYKQQIEQVSSWTFNTPTVVRFALYVSLGIGSWVGAAFVERSLGTLLGS